MPVKIGFAIVNYNEPEQLIRLVKTINDLYRTSPIVCHHDFSKCALREELFPKNMRFVHPHIVTQWGHITVPLAALRAFRLLREYYQPDWFFLLSGSDYPVRRADEVEADLSNTKYDAFIDHREILCDALPLGQTATDGGFGRPDWIPLAYDRYCTLRRPTKTSLFSGRLSFFDRRQFVPIRNHNINRMSWWFQFNRPFRIYGGAFWFHANRNAIDRLLYDPSTRRLLKYYSTRFIPEESIFHSALCNQAGLRICKHHKRYEDWSEGGAHPKWLDVSDVPKIFDSDAYFARKFRDIKALELVDSTLFGTRRR